MPAATSPTGLEHTEGVMLAALVVSCVLWFLITSLKSTRPGLRIGAAVAVGFGLRLAAIAAIGVMGLQAALRGGDEQTFLALAHLLAASPLGHGDFPHGPYQLQTVVFAMELKLGFLTVGAMRIVQVGIAMTGLVLMLAAIYDLAGDRAARLAAWVLAFEPASVFFNSALHKDPNMELASGLIVFGGTMIWQRLDVRGCLLCAFGGLIAVETRSYAGWFLVSAAVLLLFHSALRHMDRPLRAIPVIYAVVIAGVLVTPVLLQVSSKRNLQVLQQSQNANSAGNAAGVGGPNSDNLALEQVDFSTRGAILRHLPRRIADLTLRPYPWQLGDTNQRFAAIGTLFAYAVLLLLLRYAWLSRGHVFRRAAPFLYPLFFLLVAYSLSVGNAGTGFRYRTHLVTLAVGAVVILREHVVRERARDTVRDPIKGGPDAAAARSPVVAAV